MQRYYIKITLSDNNSINTCSVAESLEDGVDKITSSDAFTKIIGYKEIQNTQLIKLKNLRPTDNDRFLLKESEDPGYWLLTDQMKDVSCKFLERHYNKDHTITDLNGIPIDDPDTLSNTLKDMGDFLIAKHPELIC